MLVYRTLPDMYRALAPSYKGWIKPHVVVSVKHWDARYGTMIFNRFGSGVQKRCETYLDDAELERVRQRLKVSKTMWGESIRFGVRKTGRGYFQRRGDFCLIAGVVQGRSLTLFYRTLEVAEGICYDIAMIDELGRRLGINWRTVTFHVRKMAFYGSRSKSRMRRYHYLLKLFNA